MSPPLISPSFGSIVRTCAFLTMNSPRSGSPPETPPAAPVALCAAPAARLASTIVPSAAAAPRKPRLVISTVIQSPLARQTYLASTLLYQSPLPGQTDNADVLCWGFKRPLE